LSIPVVDLQTASASFGAHWLAFFLFYVAVPLFGEVRHYISEVLTPEHIGLAREALLSLSHL
jgi:hypothetical protein